VSADVENLRRADEELRTDRLARWTTLVVGAIFVPAGLVKFVAYGWELDAFERFGLPFAPAWVLAAGLIELVGAGLLLSGRHVVVAAGTLAVTMAVAVGVSGVAAGDVIPSLTLAPALLGGLLLILWRVRPRPNSGPSIPGLGI
jgi:uncharacterized membrane protein YphA (DoxX/SURF4 family)